MVKRALLIRVRPDPLRSLSPDVFSYADDLRVPGGMLLPSRSTVVRSAKERIAIVSPLGFDDDAARAIDALGEVEALIAPSCIHYLFLKRAIARWPKARVLGAPGLERKIPGVAFEPLPTTGDIEVLGGELRVREIEGVPYIREHVLLHARSRSLLVTDLVFNVHEARGFGMPIFLRVVGAWKKTAQSRMWRLFVKDRVAAGASLAEVLSWSFDSVVMAHGEPVTSEARERLAGALTWLTSAHRAALPA
jgi:hypothetical protein